MSYSTITKCQNIIQAATLALNRDVILTDNPERYDNIHDAYEEVRTLQGETQPTDHGETPRESMAEYLEESKTLAEAAMAKAEAEIAAAPIVPDPLPPGIVLIDEGSGSGSGL
jgi:hypothetical protein